MGQHMDYAGKVTWWSKNIIKLSLHAYLAGGKLYGYCFAKRELMGRPYQTYIPLPADPPLQELMQLTQLC